MSITQKNGSTPSLILVVDPDPDTRAMYAARLALAGWIVDGVTDGREALAKAISYRPAAVVTETRVPRLDGYELCRLLRSDPDTHHIPIVFITGDADAQRIAAAEQAGADQVLIKPCAPDELARVIEATLSPGRDRRVPRVATPPSVASKPTARAMLSRRFQRAETTTPPVSPPGLLCPQCDRPLTYQKSHVGGVSEKHREQWDTFECPAGCGQFQYRQRTRKLRGVS